MRKSLSFLGKDYAAMARQSASRGSKHFIYNEKWEEPSTYMFRHQRGTDNIFAEWRAWRRLQWHIHDIKVYGLLGFVKKFHWLNDVWRSRASEKHLQGIDELGNKYWAAWDSKGCGSGMKLGRFIEPKDPHWLRGTDWNAAPPAWHAWLRGLIAHTPQQMKARGEFGPFGRMKDQYPFKWHWEDWHVFQNNDDPGFLPSNNHHMSPWYKNQQEQGFNVDEGETLDARHSDAFMKPHDMKPEVVESFFSRINSNRTHYRSLDSDEWGVVGKG